MSFIKVYQEFLVETDTTPNNTDEDIMRETGENTVPLSNSNKKCITLFHTEGYSAGEDYFPHQKRFQTCSLKSQKEWICNLIFKSSPIVLFQMLNLRRTNTTPFQAMSHLLLVLMSS